MRPLALPAVTSVSRSQNTCAVSAGRRALTETSAPKLESRSAAPRSPSRRLTRSYWA